MADRADLTVTVNGLDVSYFRRGAGRQLLLLHGTMGGGIWFPFMDSLASKYEIIAPIHPGFAGSPMPAWISSIHDLAYFYLDFLDALGLSRVHLVGLSLGGWIAAEIAVRNTNRLASMTLVGCPGIHVRDIPQIDSFLRTDEERRRDLFFDSAPAETQALLNNSAADESSLQDRVMESKIAWQPRYHDPHLGKWLHRIDRPTLILWGAEDRIFPRAYATAFQALIRDSAVTILPNCGHAPYFERANDFVSAINEFIGSEAVS